MRFAALERNRLRWPQSCINEKLLLIKRMISTNKTGVAISDAKLKDVVKAANAQDDAISGTIVLKICQRAIRSSLIMCDLRSKSTLRTGLLCCDLVAELFN